MKAFLLKISSPEGDLFCGDVMAGHIPFVSYVKPCDCKIELEDGSEKIGHIQGGVLTVSKDKVILIAGDLVWN